MRLPKKMYLVLAAEPNSYMHGWGGEVQVDPHAVEVGSVREASRVAQRFIAENELGGSNWYLGDAGWLMGARGKVYARVAYNGRVHAMPGYKDEDYQGETLYRGY